MVVDPQLVSFTKIQMEDTLCFIRADWDERQTSFGKQ